MFLQIKIIVAKLKTTITGLEGRLRKLRRKKKKGCKLKTWGKVEKMESLNQHEWLNILTIGKRVYQEKKTWRDRCKRKNSKGWREGSVVKSTSSSSRGLQLCSQHCCNSSSRGSHALFGLCGPCIHMTQKHTHTHTKNFFKGNNSRKFCITEAHQFVVQKNLLDD